MKGSTHKKTGVLLSLLVLLSGCSAINSHQVFSERKSEVPIPTYWQSADTYVNSEFSNQLLALVEQESAAQLVEQTLAANYDLRRTAIRLEEARLLQYQAGINDRPTVNAKFEGQRSKQGQITSQQTLSLDMSWELDVWGRLADANSAAVANKQASELDYQSARNSLAARVIQAWLDISYRAKIIEVEKQWIANLISTEEIIKEQVIDGTKEQADLDAARAATAKVRATLESRVHSQSRALRSLNVLRGQTGTDIDGVTADLPQISAPPIQLSGDMIGSRPDLIAAYQRIVAADKNTAVAYKELLPKFMLTASISRSGTSMNQLLENSSVWNLVGGITAPLFDRGRLKSNAAIAELKAESSYLAYQNSLLTAITEVENAMDNEASLLRQQEYLQQALDFSQSSMRNYQVRYQDGVSGILSLLAAKQAAFQAHIQLLETEQARFSNRITLGLAVGMGV
ncbi:TolC family protein [Photobacterium chitinilyticum]|uniref:Transporter n=1 Tax=Photobacterium chitinilyticum TaxID=2485123 RepID=A0A3S3RZX3_9GAMM|nr:TolC family protein [Photobacterium chitinilyticum]RWX54534.1 transporter [Photobacterium chitinilyticum]